MYLLHDLKMLTTEKALEDIRKPGVVLKNLIHLDPSSCVKMSITYGMFVNVIRSLGTERHAQFLEDGLEANVSKNIYLQSTTL